MNLNRLRPKGVANEDLDLWLSGVINDACRDAIEAGMPETSVHHLLLSYSKHYNPYGYDATRSPPEREKK
jgi:hypothetical protein